MSLKKDTDKAFPRKLGKPSPLSPSTPARPAQPSDKPTKKLNWSMEDLLNKLPSNEEGDASSKSDVGQLKPVAEYASTIGSEESFDLSQVIEGSGSPLTISSRTDHPIISEPQPIQTSAQSIDSTASAETIEHTETAEEVAAESPAYDEQTEYAEPTAQAAEEPQVYVGETEYPEPTAQAAEEPQVYVGETEYAEPTAQAAEEPQVHVGEIEYAEPTAQAAEEPQVYVGETEYAESTAQAAEEPQVYVGETEYAEPTAQAAEEPQVYVGETEPTAQALEEPQAYVEEIAYAEPVAESTEEAHLQELEPAEPQADVEETEYAATAESTEDSQAYVEKYAESAAEELPGQAFELEETDNVVALAGEHEHSTDLPGSQHFVETGDHPVADMHSAVSTGDYPIADTQAATTTGDYPVVQSSAALSTGDHPSAAPEAVSETTKALESKPEESPAKGYSLADLESIKTPASTADAAIASPTADSAASSLLKKAIAKKSEILSKADQPGEVAKDAGSQQPPSQFNRKDVLQKLGDTKPEKEEAKPGTAEPEKPAKEDKPLFPKRRPEPETKSKFVQDLLSAAKATKAKDAQQDQAILEEVEQRKKEKYSQTGRMKTLIDAVPAADEQVVSRATIEKTKAAKENAKAWLVSHKFHLMGAAAAVIAISGIVFAFQSHEKSDMSAAIQQKVDKQKIEEGMNLVTAALAKYPSEGRFHFYKGRLLAQMRDYQGALAEQNEASRLSPNDPEILARRAWLEFYLRKNNQANTDFDQVCNNHSYMSSLPPEQRAQILSDSTGASMAVGKYKDALKYIGEAIKLQPKNIDFYRGRAWCLAAMKQTDGALKQWSEIIALAPKDPLNYVERARAEYAAKQNKAGDADLAKSMAIKPTAEAYDLTSDRLYAARNNAGALAEVSKAVAIAPKNTYVRRKRAQWLLAAGNDMAALKDLDVLDKQGVQEDDAMIARRAQIRIRAGEYSLAAHDYTKLLKNRPGDAKFLAARADCYAKAGDASLATEDYMTLIGRKPTAEWFLKRAAIYMKRNNTDLAEADFAQAIKLSPNSPDVYLSRGLTYGDARLYDQALVDMRHVLEIQPGNRLAREKLREYERVHSIAAKVQGGGNSLPPLPANLDKNNPAIAGYQLMQSGREDMALRKFAEAIKKDPNNAALRRYLANALILLGRNAEAIPQFQALSMLGQLDKPDEDKFIQASIDAQQPAYAVRIYQKRLAQNPSDEDTRFGLANAYSSMGPSSESLFHQTVQAGIANSQTKEEADRFRALEKVKDTQNQNPDAFKNIKGFGG